MNLGSTNDNNSNSNGDSNEEDDKDDDDDDSYLKWLIPVASSIGSVLLVLCIVFACLQKSEQKRAERDLALKIGRFN